MLWWTDASVTDLVAQKDQLVSKEQALLWRELEAGVLVSCQGLFEVDAMLGDVVAMDDSIVHESEHYLRGL